MAADTAAANISQIGGCVLRRPRRAALLPSEDCPSFEALGLGLDVRVVDEGLAMIFDVGRRCNLGKLGGGL
jgi:hypothetical protein